jgi:glycosyltransferase involved in cell wall biosynthesis
VLKNIIIINDFAHVNGGAGQVALSSAIGLANRGHRVFFFSAVAPILTDLEGSGVHVIVTGQHEILKDPIRLRAATQGLWNFKAEETMVGLLTSLDTENTIIHVHSWTKALSSSVIRAAIRRGFKVVCTLHDYFTVCPNGGFFDYQRRVVCMEKPLSLGCILKNCDVRSYRHKLWRVVRHVIQSTFGLMPSGIKHFITVSNFSETLLRPYLPREAKTYCIGNPIKAEHLKCVDVRKNDTFVYVGRLSPEKGVTMFAEAANRLDLEPIFIGDGESGNIIKRICPKACITGWVTGDQVTEHLIAARALVLPSLWYETQGLVVAEAAALGVPAIVPDTCAAREMVEDGHTGLWFRGGDLDDLCRKLSMLMDKYTAERMGKAAYETYWQSPCSMDRHIDQLEICYRDILLEIKSKQ